jgi:hypothetical protein
MTVPRKLGVEASLLNDRGQSVDQKIRRIDKKHNTMKKLLTLVGVLAISASLSAQGTISFASAGGGVNAPVFDLDGVTRLAGAEFQAQLFYGPEGGGLGSLSPVGNPTSFLTGGGAGHFQGGVITLPDITPGGPADFQVRAWQTLGGTITSYDAAVAGGAKFGQSTVFTTVTGGPTPNPPTALVGLQSFSLVPEPSTYALLALGAAAFLFRRRKTA